MYPHGYGNPHPSERAYPPHQNQQEHQDFYQHPHHPAQHYPSEYSSPSFSNPSFHHRPGPGARHFDDNSPPDAPHPDYRQYSFHPSPPSHQSPFPHSPDTYPPQYGFPHAPSFEARHEHSAPAQDANNLPRLGKQIFSSLEYALGLPGSQRSNSGSEHSHSPSISHEGSSHHSSAREENKPLFEKERILSSLEYALGLYGSQRSSASEPSHSPSTSQHGSSHDSSAHEENKPPFEKDQILSSLEYALGLPGSQRSSASEHSHSPSISHQGSTHEENKPLFEKEQILSSLEYAFGLLNSRRSSALEHSLSPSISHQDSSHHSSVHEENKPPFENTYEGPGFDYSSPSIPNHIATYIENKDGSATERLDSLDSMPPPPDVELPKGQLVRIFCKANRSFNLAVKGGRLAMVDADSENESQKWIRDDKYSIRIRDSSGHPAFMLINKASKMVLKHASGKLKEVQLAYYSPDIQDDDLFWTESQDFGEGFKSVRMASNTHLNLSVGSGHKIEERSRLILDTWHKKDTQLWKIFPL